MSKVNPKRIDQQHRMKCLDILWTSVSQLKTREEAKNFFKDLLSESEAIMLARRIIIAQYLLLGKTYDEIVEELKVGSDTVAKVHQWLISGFGGYENAIKRFEKEIKHRIPQIKSIEEYKGFGFKWLKKKYPLHFLLFNLIDKLSDRE